MLVGQMTTADPTRSPAGTEALWAYTHVPQESAHDAGTARSAARGTGTTASGWPTGCRPGSSGWHPGFGSRVLDASDPRAAGARGTQRQPGRRLAQRRHRAAAPAARLPPVRRRWSRRDGDPRPLPRLVVGPPGRRRARGPGHERRARRRSPMPGFVRGGVGSGHEHQHPCPPTRPPGPSGTSCPTAGSTRCGSSGPPACVPSTTPGRSPAPSCTTPSGCGRPPWTTARPSSPPSRCTASSCRPGDGRSGRPAWSSTSSRCRRAPGCGSRRTPSTGRAASSPALLRHPLIGWRNTETLRRLAYVVEGRTAKSALVD